MSEMTKEDKVAVECIKSVALGAASFRYLCQRCFPKCPDETNELYKFMMQVAYQAAYDLKDRYPDIPVPPGYNEHQEKLRSTT